jgi:hypothetical protein
MHDDELSAEAEDALHASLDRALEDSEAGRGVDAIEYLRRYRERQKQDRLPRVRLPRS